MNENEMLLLEHIAKSFGMSTEFLKELLYGPYHRHADERDAYVAFINEGEYDA